MGDTSSVEDELRQRIAQLEAKLAEAESDRTYLLDALDHVPVGLEIYDQNGLAVWMNRAMVQFLGLPSADVAIGKFNVLTDPFSVQTGLQPVYERAYRGELVETEEFAIDMERATDEWGASSRLIWFRMVLVPRIDESGRVTSVCAVVQETTQDRQMQHTLRLAQRREGLELLAGGVAHDFNNLLTAILGQASILEAGIAEEGEVEQSGREIVHAAQQAAALTSQLLAYAGKGRGALEPTDLRTVVGEIAQLVRVTFSKTTRLDLDLGDTPAVALVDGAQIKQVVMNLITNAHQALEDDMGTVRVQVSVRQVNAETLSRVRSSEVLEPGPYVLLDVVDDGCGMDAQTLDRVFEPYFTTKATGHGLGLAAALGTVMGHHGAVLIESKLGEGTRFSVLLPHSDEEPIHIPSVAAPRCDNRGLVLVADDEPYVRSLLTRVLERTGYSVVVANDGSQVIDEMDQHGEDF
ncbi:MAG: PAS domain-containing protein, partial [Deltaproteobacteria bacterium]|nr:PAS domain-containing protein [Deltaproteobacteria bacterium]